MCIFIRIEKMSSHKLTNDTMKDSPGTLLSLGDKDEDVANLNANDVIASGTSEDVKMSHLKLNIIAIIANL